MIDITEGLPKNQVIVDNMLKAYSIINSPEYKRAFCSVSGGADSDVMMDIVRRCDKDNKVDFVWYDTGLEYQATKDHLKILQEKYRVEIKPIKAQKSIPLSCKTYGQPFISKRVSDYTYRLQSHDFQFEDESYEVLSQKYPKCLTALCWWTNNWGEKSSFNINRNAWLKEFMVANPPTFKISDKCCTYSKKNLAHGLERSGDYQLCIFGIRKAEGGARATSHKSCFSDATEVHQYLPVFWYSDKDKLEYEREMHIEHSDCYTKYGLKRTGCAGCPFGRDFEFELKVIEEYEPKLYKAVNNIFGDSYAYTRAYHKFVEEQNAKYGSYAAYLREKAEK